MKKLLTALLSVSVILMPLQMAQANDQKVLAIIDTAIDSTKVPSVIYEACFTSNQSCPNETNSMEGKGSANSTGPIFDRPGASGKKIRFNCMAYFYEVCNISWNQHDTNSTFNKSKY